MLALKKQETAIRLACHAVAITGERMLPMRTMVGTRTFIAGLLTVGAVGMAPDARAQCYNGVDSNYAFTTTN